VIIAFSEHDHLLRLFLSVVLGYSSLSIPLIDSDVGEEKAQTFAIACPPIATAKACNRSPTLKRGVFCQMDFRNPARVC
jgi:hypothetical protein